MFTENYHKLQQLYLNAANPAWNAKTTTSYVTSDTSIRLVDTDGHYFTLSGPYNGSGASNYGYALPYTLLKPFTNCNLCVTNNTEAAYSDYAVAGSGLTRISSYTLREIIGSDENKSLKVSIGGVFRNGTSAAISAQHLMIDQYIYEDTQRRFVIFSHHLNTPITIEPGERKKIEVSLTFPMYY